MFISVQKYFCNVPSLSAVHLLTVETVLGQKLYKVYAFHFVVNILFWKYLHGNGVGALQMVMKNGSCKKTEIAKEPQKINKCERQIGQVAWTRMHGTQTGVK